LSVVTRSVYVYVPLRPCRLTRTHVVMMLMMMLVCLWVSTQASPAAALPESIQGWYSWWCWSVCVYVPRQALQERCNDDAYDALQVASSIIESATQGQIVNGDYSGTPNRFLMTYLDTSPSVSITPEALPPVILFAGMTYYDMYIIYIYI